MRRLAVSPVLAVLFGFLSGCGGGGSSSPGSLTVDITGPNAMAPSPASVSVTVTGPGGYQKVLTATATLSGLSPGSYTISAAPSRLPGDTVAIVYDGVVTGSPASVTSGGTATASVTYPAARGGTGRLWVTDKVRQEMQGYTDLQLGTSGSPAPDVAIGTGAGSQTYGVAVGPGGSLWVALPSQHLVARYDPAQLESSGTPTPAATLSTVGQLVENIAFDRAGNLWVDVTPSGSATTPTIVRFPAAALGGTGALPSTPAITWTLPSVGMSAKILFDDAGNLWILNAGDYGAHPTTIMRVDAGALEPSGFSPAATITSSDVFFAQGAAFDEGGALWIAVLNASGASPGVNLVRYSSSQLAVTGTQTVDPEAVITVSGAVSLGSLAFDEAGNLWLEDYSGRTVSRLQRSLIVAAGSYGATPDIVVHTPAPGTPGAGITGLAFDPPPPGLPLAQ